jgi:hypothetical protein
MADEVKGCDRLSSVAVVPSEREGSRVPHRTTRADIRLATSSREYSTVRRSERNRAVASRWRRGEGALGAGTAGRKAGLFAKDRPSDGRTTHGRGRASLHHALLRRPGTLAGLPKPEPSRHTDRRFPDGSQTARCFRTPLKPAAAERRHGTSYPCPPRSLPRCGRRVGQRFRERWKGPTPSLPPRLWW